jgi:hypothetical protein
MKRLVFALILLALTLPWPRAALAQIEMAESVVGSGGGGMGDATYTLGGTVGQPVTGSTGGPSHISEIGFWFQSFLVFVDIGSPFSVLPAVFSLEQNAPNPFGPRTTIAFALPQPEHVTVRLYDVTGRLVRTLVDESVAAGYHHAVFDGRGLASGIYYFRMTAGDYDKTRSLVLMK